MLDDVVSPDVCRHRVHRPLNDYTDIFRIGRYSDSSTDLLALNIFNFVFVGNDFKSLLLRHVLLMLSVVCQCNIRVQAK